MNEQRVEPVCSPEPNEPGKFAPEKGAVGEKLLEVVDLVTVFQTHAGTVRAVDGVDLTLRPGEAVGIVGESGCGKSVTSLSLMRLIDSPPGEIRAGRMRFKGHDLLALSERELCNLRGNELAMIFQEPMTSLNPVFSIGDQISETLRRHRGLKRRAAREEAVALLDKVGITAAAKRIADYPHQLSGGMRQRVMIAMALACAPSLLIADEPTTALDVTIQAQILELLRQVQAESGMAIILISHDLGMVADLVERVVVMYAGVVVENGPVQQLYAQPWHPYTQGLLTAVPRLDFDLEWLNVIPGAVPDPLHPPTGCRFHPRCTRRMEQCSTQEPPLFTRENRQVRCWLVQGGGER